MPTGQNASEQATRLKKIGAWLAKNGGSIYGTRGGPFRPGDYGVSTRKGNTIYLHLCEGFDELLKLPAIPAKVVHSHVLNGGKVVVRQSETGLEISVPQSDRQPEDTVVALELDREALGLPAVDALLPPSLIINAKATASNVYQNQVDYGLDKAVDGRGDTRWATDAEVKSAWLEVDRNKPVTFSRAAIKQAFPELNRIRKFAIEYMETGQWKPCCQGVNLGSKFAAKFKPYGSPGKLDRCLRW